MKFSPKIFTLFTLTTACAYSINNKLVSRDSAEEEYKYANECKKTLDSYKKECIPYEEDAFSPEKLKATCDKLTTQRCVAFLNDPYKISNCDKIMKPSDLDDFKQVKIISEIACSKDEKNEFCPFAKFNIYRIDPDKPFIKRNPTEDEVKKAVNETCNSPKCHKIVGNYFAGYPPSFFGLDFYGYITGEVVDNSTEIQTLTQLANDLLKSKECKAYGINTSGAIAIKVNYSLLFISLVLLLSYL